MLAPGLPALAGVALILLLGKILGLYDREEWLIRKSTLDEAPRLFQLATLYAIAVWLINDVWVPHVSDRRELLVIWPTVFAALLMMRAGARWACRHITSPERCLVIGDERTCARMRLKLSRSQALHATLAAHIPVHDRGTAEEAFRMLSDHEDLQLLADSYQIDRIILAPERADAEEVLNLIRSATVLGIKVSVVPRVLEVVAPRPSSTIWKVCRCCRCPA